MVWSIAIRRRLLGSLICSVWVVSAPVSATEPPTADAPPAVKPVVPTAKSPAAKPQKPAKKPAVPSALPSRYRPDRFAGRAGQYYRLIWGVDSLTVKWTESGEIIRFSYRVLDPDKAKALSEKKSEPSLNDPRAGVSLVVPSMEQVGPLRQSADPEEGKSYWMAFSNKGRLVKRGDRVNVVIGQFHADGLVID
jgi:hypothetical protein